MKNKFSPQVMFVYLQILNEQCFVKREFNSSTKSIDSDLPAQLAQADLSRNVLL